MADIPVFNVMIETAKLRDGSTSPGCRIIATANFGGEDSSTSSVDVGMLPPDFQRRLQRLQDELLQQAPTARRISPRPFLRRDAPAAPAVRPVPLAPRIAVPVTAETVGAIGAENAPTVPGGPAPPSAVAAAPVRKGEATPSAATSAADKMVEEIGAELFSFLFSEIQDLFVKSLAKADKLQRPLFIRLCVTHPDLAAVPWEALYEPKKRSYVSTSEVTPLIRSVDLNQGKGIPPGEGPLRILVMASRVRTLRGVMIDSLEVDDELDMIKAALESLGKRVSFELVPSAKPRDLGRSLKTGEGEDGNRWDIFHFIGHGGYDADRRMGYIVVQELGGPKGEKLYTQDLKQYLVKPGKTPSLVVLNSCSGAAEQKGQLFSSTAAELIQAGIPAVVAMQFEVSDDMGKEFAASFYGYLADGYSIQDALTATRLDLKFKGFSEWITPVLYMQSTDPGVFRPRKTAASGAAPRQ